MLGICVIMASLSIRLDFFFVMFSVSFAFSIRICHHLLRSSVDTDEWCPLDWGVFACIKYYNSIPTWNNFLGIDLDFTLENQPL